MTETRVIRVDEDGREFVLHTITPTSKYTNFSTGSLFSASAQMACAERLKNGWEQNGRDSSYFGNSTIRIEQTNGRFA